MTDATGDTGPFIHLAEVSVGHALDIFSRIHVPPSVVAELRAKDHLPGAELLARPNVHPANMSEPERAHARQISRTWDASRADSDALATTASRRTILVTDDLDLREAAKSFGVKPVGTIGVLVRARTTDVLTTSEAHDALDALVAKSTLFITQRLIERAKAALTDAT